MKVTAHYLNHIRDNFYLLLGRHISTDQTAISCLYNMTKLAGVLTEKVTIIIKNIHQNRCKARKKTIITL